MNKPKVSKLKIKEMFLEEQRKDKYANPNNLYKKFGYTNASTLNAVLREFQIKYKPFNKNTVIHNEYDKQVLEGNLLGDGFIYFTSKRANYPIFSVEYKYEEYCKYIQQNNPFLNNRKINYRKRVSDRYNNGFVEQYNCKSLSSGILLDEYQRWYSTGVKIVPRDLQLTPLSMLIWYLDDGFTASACKGIYIATDGFSLDDNYYLQEQLNKFNIKTNFHKASSKNNVRLYIPAKNGNAKDFLNIIGPCPVKCYQYKWK